MNLCLAWLCLLHLSPSLGDVQESYLCKEDNVSLSLSLLQNNIVLKQIGTQTVANHEAQTGLSMAHPGYDLNPWTKDVYECLSTVLRRLDTANGACTNQCGSITRDFKQTTTYMSLASSPSVKNICETGFYTGYSSAIWLCTNPSAHLYSFDLEFPAASLKVIQEAFEDRFSYFEGDSSETLTKFAADPSSPFCDIMVADGGHFGKVPWSDLNNFAKISAQEPDRKHTFLVDEIYFDIDTGCCMDVTTSFEKAVSLNMFDAHSSYCLPYVEARQLFNGQPHSFMSPSQVQCLLDDHNHSFCDHSFEIATQTFPIVGEVTLKSKYPIGGYCILSFARDFLGTLSEAALHAPFLG